MTTSLAGWQKYFSGPVAGSPDAAAQDFLTRIQQYDPTARFEAASAGGSEDPQGYRLVYNPNAIPKPTTGGGATPYRELDAQGHIPSGYVLDPSKVYDDPVYGKWLASDNTRDGSTPVTRWGPVAVAALTAGAGLLGGAGGGTTLGQMGGVGDQSGWTGAFEDMAGGDMGGNFGGQFGSDAASQLGGSTPTLTNVGDQAGWPGATEDLAPGPNQTYPPGEVPGSPGAPGTPASKSVLDTVKSLFPSITDLGTLGSLANLLGPVLSGYLTNKATGTATDQVLAGIDKAGKQATDLLGGNQAIYKPYTDAGPGGIAALQGMMGSNLAGNFKPIANSNIAGQFQPLGAGRGLTMGQMARGR